MNHNLLAHICEQSYLRKSFVINECEVLIELIDGFQVVAFRGTEAGALFAGAGWVDVIRDMRIMPWYDKDTGWAHAGFLKGGRLMADFLADQLSPRFPIVCTGHSLGGALALACAVKLQAHGFEVAEWVGFASPKFQFTDKQYSFKQTNYRYRADVVPLMPRYTTYRHNCPIKALNPEAGRKATWDDHNIKYYLEHVL